MCAPAHAAGVAALAALFALLTWQVAVDGPLLRADTALRDAAARAAPGGGAVSGAAQVCADLGGALVALPVLAFGACLLGVRRRTPVPAVLAALSALAVPALVLPLKEVCARVGPDGAPLGEYAGYYPSGHTATAALAYGTLALLYVRRGPRAAPTSPAPGSRAGYAVAAAVVVNLCVGAGLVLRGYHWATDVVASWALAGLVLYALAALGDRLDDRLRARREQPRERAGER
ncbi:phosphatase PAP2 family protein [Streptomyces sp. NPDC054784]